MSKIRYWVETCPIEELVELKENNKAPELLKCLVNKALELDSIFTTSHIGYCLELMTERVRQHKTATAILKVIEKHYPKRWNASGVLDLKELEDSKFQDIAEACRMLAEKRKYKNPIKYFSAIMEEAFK